jgi:hypothetical protein
MGVPADQDVRVALVAGGLLGLPGGLWLEREDGEGIARFR